MKTDRTFPGHENELEVGRSHVSRTTQTFMRKGEVTSADLIVEAVIEAICAKRLPPGTKLGESRLAGIFGVSRTVVRQAIQRLGFIGVVRTDLNRSAVVVTFTLKQAADLYLARRVIEAEVVRILAKHCTANDIRMLRQHIGWERETEAANNRLELVNLRSNFHLVMAKLAGNQVLTDILAKLLPQIALLGAFYGEHKTSCEPTNEHERLIDFLASGDVEKCVALIDEHLHFDERRLAIPARTGSQKVDVGQVLRASDLEARI